MAWLLEQALKEEVGFPIPTLASLRQPKEASACSPTQPSPHPTRGPGSPGQCLAQVAIKHLSSAGLAAGQATHLVQPLAVLRLHNTEVEGLEHL